MDNSCREKKSPTVVSVAPATVHSMGADMGLSNLEYLHSHPNLTKEN